MLHRMLAVLFLAGTAATLTAQSSVSFEMYADNYYLTTTTDIVSGDFNNDGKPDLIECCGGSTQAPMLEFRAGNGDGTFQPAVTAGAMPFAPSGVSSLIAVDLNGDGKLDLVGVLRYGGYGGAPEDGGVEVWMGNGDGTFQTAVPYSTPNGAISVAVGNFFNDGMPDLAVGEIYGNIQLFRNQGDGSFVIAKTISLGGGSNSWVQLAAGDLNGDLTDQGPSDIAAAITTTEPPNATYVLWNDGNGNFTPVELGTYNTPTVGVARLNGDGMKDVIVSYTCSPAPCTGFDVYYGQGNNKLFKRTVVTDPGVSTTGQPFAVDYGEPIGVDVNGDGYGDIVSTGGPSSSQYGLYVWTGNADGSFQQTPHAFLSNTLSAGPLAMGDFNRDGMMDFAMLQIQSENAEFFINSTDRPACGTYTISPTVTVCQPVDNTYATSPVTVQANSWDTTKVTSMQEYVDENLEYSEPVTSLDTTFPVSDGTHLFVTKAWDASGASFSAVRNITAYSGSPGPVCPAATDSASICLPSGTASGSPVEIVANADTGMVIPEDAQLSINGIVVVNNKGATTYVDTTQNLVNGVYDLVFTETDASGNVYQAQKTITVN
jgi:FG-GAP-like repeat